MKKQYPKTKLIQKLIFKPHCEKKEVQIPQLSKPVRKNQGVQIQGYMGQVLSGRPGSGKTHVLSQFLTRKEFYGNKFDRILYITPSNIEGIIHDEQINTNRRLDATWITNKIKQCESWATNILLVLDDVVSDLPSGQKNQLKTIFYNRRHLLPKGTVSIIVTSQKYTAVPMWIRIALNQVIAFQIQPSQIKTMSQQLNTGKETKLLNKLFGDLNKHQFIFLNIELGKAYDYNFKLI